MGFLDDLKDAFSKQATKPKSNKTQGEKIVENILTATATLNGKTKEATIKVVSPTIKSVTWGIPIKQRKTKPKVTITTIDAKEIDKTANGVNTSLYIKTEQAERCNALIVLESEAWEGYFESHLILIGNTGKTDLKEQDTVVITPDTKHWKKTSTKNSKISATVYLFTYTSRTWSLEDNPEALALSFNRKLKSPNPSISPSCAEQFKRLILHNSVKSEIDFDYCGHGMEYREGVVCASTKARVNFGPLYNGHTRMNHYSNWQKLINQNLITIIEKKVICAMADNEGCFESVQSYDNQVLSLGAMQKTISPDGTGQLSQQIYEFKEEYPNDWKLYECCFNYHKWTFEKVRNNYIAKYDGKIGKEINDEIRKGFNSKNIGEHLTSPLCEPFIKLAHDGAFQEKQVLDFIKKIRKVLSKTIGSYENRRITEYIKTALGQAIVLDHEVNREAHVVPCFKITLDRFFDKNPSIDKNPNSWGNDHSKYEKEILDIYGPIRGDETVTFKVLGKETKASMTNAKKRYNDLKGHKDLQ